MNRFRFSFHGYMLLEPFGTVLETWLRIGFIVVYGYCFRYHEITVVPKDHVSL